MSFEQANLPTLIAEIEELLLTLRETRADTGASGD
jgi:hypothetical protein